MPTLFCGLNIDSVVNFPADNYWFCRLTDLSGNLVSGGGLLTHLWRACDPPWRARVRRARDRRARVPAGLWPAGLWPYTRNMCSPSLEMVTRTTYRPTKIFVTSIRVGLKLRRKSEGLAYENAENRYPRRTIRPKIDPLAHVRRIPKA